MHRGMFVLGLILVLGGPLQSALASAGQTDVVLSPRHYELAIEVDYDTETIQGNTRILVANPSNKPVTYVSLLLYRLMQAKTVSNDRGQELEFTQHVVPFSDFGKLQINHIVVTLAEPLAPQAETAIRVEYAGYLLGYSETGMHYIQDHISPDFTILRDDSWAYPRPGYPSLSVIREIPQPSFTYSARITVPQDLTVANGGRLVSSDKHDDKVTYVYASIKPSWRMDFAIAKYSLLSEGPIRIYCLPGDEEGAAGVARAARTALGLFETWFGALRGEKGLAFIEIPDGWGSQTDVTAIIQTAAAFRDPTLHREVYHEVSHLWNVPATDRPSPRLEEGLATFLEYLVTQEATGNAVVEARADQLMEWLRQELPRHPAWRKVPLLEYGQAQLTDLSYSVGALMFDLLYRLVGPAGFNKAIGNYYQQFGEPGGTTEDFIQLISRNSPTDLSRLFEDWIYTSRWAERVVESRKLQDLLHHYEK